MEAFRSSSSRRLAAFRVSTCLSREQRGVRDVHADALQEVVLNRKHYESSPRAVPASGRDRVPALDHSIGWSGSPVRKPS